MAVWVTPQVNAVESDASTVYNDLSNGNASQASVDCAAMSTDLGNLQSDPGIPNAQANTLWQQALSEDQQAMGACQDDALVTSGDDLGVANK